MSNGNERIDRIEALLERNDRIDRVEVLLERSTQLLQQIGQNQGQIIQIQEQQQEQIQVLVSAATRHNALIDRLDAIIERLIYREGRDGSESPRSS